MLNDSRKSLELLAGRAEGMRYMEIRKRCGEWDLGEEIKLSDTYELPLSFIEEYHKSLLEKKSRELNRGQNNMLPVTGVTQNKDKIKAVTVVRALAGVKLFRSIIFQHLQKIFESSSKFMTVI